MGNDSHENDPRAIWQNQPTVPSAMTLEMIRQKVRHLHAKTRWRLLGNLITSFIVVVFYSFGIRRFHHSVLRSMFAFAIAWSLVGLYFLNRGMWSAMLPEDVALSNSLESYRREVERQRSLSGRFLVWGFGPVIFATATLVVLILTLGIERGMSFSEALLKMIPFLTLLVIWLVHSFVIRMRQQRQLQHEIDQLNDIEGENKR
jgi:hypothetical protein